MLSFFSLFFSTFGLLYSTPNGSSIYGANASLSQQQGAVLNLEIFALGVGKKSIKRARALCAHTLAARNTISCVLCLLMREKERMKGFAGEAEKRARNSPAAALSLSKRVALMHNGTPLCVLKL
jgi:hypothetical protein